MKWFNRKPKTRSAFDELCGLLRANPGVWIEWPANVGLALVRRSFLLYDVKTDPEGTVWIRKKLNPGAVATGEAR